MKKLTEARIAEIGVAHGLATLVPNAGCKNDVLWFNGDLTDFVRAIETTIERDAMTTNRDAALAMREAAVKITETSTDRYSCAALIRALPLPEVEPSQPGFTGTVPPEVVQAFTEGTPPYATAPQQVEPACEWRIFDREFGEYATTCNQVFKHDNTMKFCPGCGKPLVVKEKKA